jgi:Zn-finger nucleic acid-binding protein/DNA-directed RNA polymerase subunit RPC12/RpoP
MLVACLRCSRHVDTQNAAPGDTVKCSCGLAILVPEGPSTAGKMNCPGCGAPVDPALRKCTFCASPLATVICPSCFGMVFQGAKHCQHCGAGLEGKVVVHGEATKRTCPRCQEPLRVSVAGGIPLERCMKCDGLWVDKDTVEKVYKCREKAGAVQQVATPLKRATTSTITALKDGYLKCPECGTLMHRKNFGKYSGVLLDVCTQHGTWFDADELRRVGEFISSGGLEKAAKREKEKLEEEVRQLKAQRSTAHSGGGGSGGLFTGKLGPTSDPSVPLAIVKGIFRLILR